MILDEFKQNVQQELMPLIKDYLYNNDIKGAYQSLFDRYHQSLFLTLLLYTSPEKLGEAVGDTLPGQVFRGMPVPSEVVLPAGITTVKMLAFQCCRDLTSITIPDGATSIGRCAFEYCENLESIIIPNSVTSIEPHVFDGCVSLKNITLPDKITCISDYLFYQCESLTSIVIPDSVTSIENRAFAYCENLTDITIPNSVTRLGDYIFQGCKKLKVKAPRKFKLYKDRYWYEGIEESQIEWY